MSSETRSRRPAAPRLPSRRAVLDGIAAVARRHLGWEGELSPRMRLIEDLRLDSLRLLTLAVEVENRFRVRLDADDEAAIETVGDLVAIVRAKLAAGASGPAGGSGAPAAAGADGG